MTETLMIAALFALDAFTMLLGNQSPVSRTSRLALGSSAVPARLECLGYAVYFVELDEPM
jgi:hypothetical protein